MKNHTVAAHKNYTSASAGARRTGAKRASLAKTLLIAGAITGAGVFSATATMGQANAWGPERPTFTMENPATYPVFNSITNNPTIGDERDFVRVGQINADVTELSNEVEIIPGRQYLVYIYVHNNASSTYNSAAEGRKGIAQYTRVSTSFDKVVTKDTKGTITGTVTADNSDPLSVWDEAYFTTTRDKVLLHYVDGSAKIRNDWGTNGSTMPSKFFSEEGAFIGLNGFNGLIPGCEEYHSVITYVLQADELKGTVEKSVSRDGENFQSEITDVAPGDEVTYKLTIKNAGDIALTNAVIKDNMPEKLTLVKGTTELWANNSDVKDKLEEGDITAGGYNLETIGTGNTVYISYRAKVAEDVNCAGVTLENAAKLVYDSDVASGDSSTAKAVVKTKNVCTPDTPDTPTPETPEPEKPTPETPEPEKPEPDKPEPTPVPTPEDTPEDIPTETPSEIVNTGPLEITLAVVIVLGIAAGGFYYYRTHRVLKNTEEKVKGKEEK